MSSPSSILFVAVILYLCAKFSESLERRVFGGTEAEDAEFPYQVSLKFLQKYICGGSIINEKTVLTAAHCFLGVDKLTVTAGTNTIAGGGEQYESERLIGHDKYSTLSKLNDIGLVILDRCLLFGRRVQPIRLEHNYVNPGGYCSVSGWGETENGMAQNLQKIVLKTIGEDDCNIRFIEAGCKTGCNVNEKHVCTLGKKGQGLCRGDSGGPLTSNDKQIGVVSWGLKFCDGGHPNVYVRVSAYIDWINQHLHHCDK
ncbi:hypothetical protein FQR65_LT03488 [Abscondita terminalis]|nr:hypothetical protein FQR65_LT03488 [Abscondita terminalis]